ncbi:MAG: UDP-4-amino-4,6-dideoxy-N-acetyl-beta-L-altrosamine transaminase [Magnetococcales bacterium]|nr:UDP-4-amino-4,6-dideoxy-N-acetyl-beta-L-altrosamine transaminase [Magnetococcales bacterium]
MTVLPFLPYGRQVIDETDIAAVTEVLRGDWLTCGPAVPRFEEALAASVNAPYAVACSSGTAALHLAALALELGPGDAVVVPAVTFLATANAARFVGAEVIFADVHPDTGLMGVAHLEEALARVPAGLTPKALFLVHLAGRICPELPRMRAVAAAHGMVVVEDACHALGSAMTFPDGAKTRAGDCQYSAMTVFSFHPVKTVAMGEGGALTTRSADLHLRLTRLRAHGMTRDPAEWLFPQQGLAPDGQPNPWYYEMPQLGFNYRASDIHCALGASQLARLESFVRKRKELAQTYDRLLHAFAPDLRTPEPHPGCEAAWHLYVIRVDFARLGIPRARFMNRLRDKGVGSQVHYLPLHLQPYYRQRHGDLRLPGAEAWYARCLSLPLYPALSDADQARVAEAVGSALA